jgi:TolB-like protein
LGYFAIDKFVLAPTDTSLRGATDSSQTRETGPQTIAVLPFVNMSEDQGNEYFSDGLTEELLNILAKSKGLHVAGRTSSFAFKGKDDDLRIIGEKLNVGNILEGSVRKDDARNRVRITAQLINVENGYHLWSDTFDRELDDIFAIQEEVAGEVAKALRVTLLGEEAEQPSHIATTGFNAYDLYLHGLQGINENSYASLNQAVEDFQNSLALDPSYTPAQIGLISAWQALASTGAITRKEAVDLSLPLLTVIMQREPDNSDAYVLLGQAQLTTDHEAVDQTYRDALERNPRNVKALLELGAHLRNHEHVDEGMQYIQRAAQIEPYSVSVQWELCWSHMWMQNLQGALQACERVREIEPDNPNGYSGASLAYQLDGNVAQSIFWDTQAHERDPDDYELTAGLAIKWLDLGDLEMADHWMEVSESLDADQISPIAAKVSLLQYREQFTLAAQLAFTTLERENRFFSRQLLRNAFVADALNQGDTQAALDAYSISHEEIFKEPMEINFDMVSWGVDSLIEIALVMRSGDFASSKADELLQAAQTILEGAHPSLTPWLADIRWAALKNARGDSQAALGHLRNAFEHGFRFRWRFRLQHWFALESLHSEPEYIELVALSEKDMERQREETHILLGTGS